MWLPEGIPEGNAGGGCVAAPIGTKNRHVLATPNPRMSELTPTAKTPVAN